MKKNIGNLITGINGMDGGICLDFLLEKGYKVYGMERHSSLKNRTNTKHLESQENFEFITGDLTDRLHYFQNYQL